MREVAPTLALASRDLAALEAALGTEAPWLRRLGVAAEGEDAADAVAFAVAWLAEHGLEDSSPLWRALDARAFPLEVRLWAAPGTLGSTCLIAAASALAQRLSVALAVQVAIHDPRDESYAVYDAGTRVMSSEPPPADDGSISGNRPVGGARG